MLKDGFCEEDRKADREEIVAEEKSRQIKIYIHEAS